MPPRTAGASDEAPSAYSNLLRRLGNPEEAKLTRRR
jgi:hypothetical protein